MATYILMAEGSIRDCLVHAPSSGGDFVMTRSVDNCLDCYSSLLEEPADALSLQTIVPMCTVQNLILDLKAENACPSIILFSAFPDRTIHYAVSDEGMLPLSVQLAAYFERVLAGNYLCLNSETQKRTRLDEMVRKLVSVVGSRKSIRCLSVRVKNISDFRILYNSYLSERNVSFFTKDLSFSRNICPR